MALRGTIKDFGLPDIFQLIGIQRKTGVLTLENGTDCVSVKFLDGQVVGADTRTQTVEDRLGSLLVRTGKVRESELQEALRLQKNTMQRLGYILVSSGYISEEDLVEALRVQSTQIIYRLFRWRDGTYHFTAVDDLDYDQRHFKPISSETILMEGARMIDEWPIIERRVRSPEMVLRKTDAGMAAERHDPRESPHGAMQDTELADGGVAVAEHTRTATLATVEERAIMALVDGRRSVQEISDLSTIGEFESYRILSELLTRNLIEEVRRSPESLGKRRDLRLKERLLAAGLAGAIALLAMLALATLADNPLTPWAIGARRGSHDSLRLYASLARLELIEKAVRISYLDTGVFPTNLASLAQRGYLAPSDLQDPWGQAYRYELSDGGYQLFGHDGAGRQLQQLTISRRFDPVQRMMHAGGAP
jgi:hypothetical protein